jgi:hypothetical protein
MRGEYVQRKLNAHPRGALEPYNVVAFKGDGEMWAVWAVGFMEGVYFYANEWAALRRTKAFKAAIAPLDVLGGQYLGEPVSGLNETTDQRARVGALIPTSVGKLHALWQRRHAKSFDAVRNALGSAAVRLHYLCDGHPTTDRHLIDDTSTDDLGGFVGFEMPASTI